jgi:hypothetical protein
VLAEEKRRPAGAAAQAECRNRMPPDMCSRLIDVIGD